MEKILIETEIKNGAACEKSKACDIEKNEENYSENQEEFEEVDISKHEMTKNGSETFFHMFQPTPEKKRKREVPKKFQ